MAVNFKVGDKVCMTLPQAGRAVAVTGVVVSIVKPRTKPASNVQALRERLSKDGKRSDFACLFSGANFRPFKSYLVMVESEDLQSKLYWPMDNMLERAS